MLLNYSEVRPQVQTAVDGEIARELEPTIYYTSEDALPEEAGLRFGTPQGPADVFCFNLRTGQFGSPRVSLTGSPGVRSVGGMDQAVAERLAGGLLAPLGDRWRHVQAVAAAARELAGAVDPGDRDLLVTAAWLHDIGYAPQIAHLRFHPVDGARYLDSLHAPRRLCALVAHHSCARIEAEERGLSAELAPWELETSAVMDALCMADMTTGPQGQRMTFDERVAEICSRYGEGTVVARSINRARPLLQESIDRTLARLGAVQPR